MYVFLFVPKFLFVFVCRFVLFLVVLFCLAGMALRGYGSSRHSVRRRQVPWYCALAPRTSPFMPMTLCGLYTVLCHFVVLCQANISPLHVGKLIFPKEYPYKPPSIMMLTPNGRFKLNSRLCLSMSDFHPESWFGQRP